MRTDVLVRYRSAVVHCQDPSLPTSRGVLKSVGRVMLVVLLRRTRTSTRTGILTERRLEPIG